MLRVTKQAETRDLVLDLIEQLAVGDAIPSERQLTADFGVSRLTVRAALDDLVREGYLVRRHGSGTFVSEPKIAQELTMTSFTDDMRSRGLRPASETLDLRDRPGRRASRPASPRLAVGACPRRRRAQACRRREHGDRDRAHPRLACARTHRTRSRGAVLLRAAARSLRDRRRRRRADDRADGHRRGRVGALGVPLHSPAFRFERVTHSQAGEIVEFVESIYRGDRYRLVTSLSIPQERRRARAHERGGAGSLPAWLVPTAR